MAFAEVYFPLPLRHGYTYRIPEPLRDNAQIGCRVLVPLGPRRVTGFLVNLTETTHRDGLKEILEVLDPEPIFSRELLELAQWLAEYYLCSLGEALRVFLPPAMEKRSRQFVFLQREPNEDELIALSQKSEAQERILRLLLRRQRMSVTALLRKINPASVRAALAKLSERGFVSSIQSFDKRIAAEKFEQYVEISPAGKELLATPEKPQRQRSAATRRWLELLAAQGRPLPKKAFMLQSGVSSAQLQQWRKKGWISCSMVHRDRNPYPGSGKPAPVLVLNHHQEAAVGRLAEAAETNCFAPFLLLGVTGSGKTQVYIEAIRRVLARGKGAIVLVPEISLTPQTVERFHANFHGEIAVMHSGISPGERLDAWRRVREGQARVVVGARSAVFAPVKNLGLIIVDEEHDASYKQSDPAPRYQARDVAVMRCKKSSAVAVLGSATPSTESYFNALHGKYHLLELPNRIEQAPMPEVQIVDLARLRRVQRDADSVLSPALQRSIADKLSRGEQIILLQNRRGFAPLLRCQDCGYVRRCEKCDIPMTYHRRGKMLRCHHCNASGRAPEACPQCASADILYTGVGTQRVEAALAEQFPQARLVRMDLDTTRGRLAHDRILKDFESHRYDILLGTQMVAKGLDFHNVTFVGVISADVGLLLPDFRAAERSFQLLAQVAGRAGRGSLAGEAIIQSSFPEHVGLACARDHDFKKFFNYEIQQRQRLGYPPFNRLALILFRHVQESQTREAAQKFAEILKAQKPSFSIYGPAPSPLERINNQFRYQILLKNDRVKDAGAVQMRQALGQALSDFRAQGRFSRGRIIIDIDPVSML
jgi:primosomal protein N' (replication factor Y)